MPAGRWLSRSWVRVGDVTVVMMVGGGGGDGDVGGECECECAVGEQMKATGGTRERDYPAYLPYLLARALSRWL